MKVKIYNFWEGFSIIFLIFVALPSVVVVPILHYTTDVFEFLHEMKFETFVVAMLLLIIVYIAMILTVLEKNQTVALFIFIVTIHSYILLALASTTDDISRLAKPGSIINMIVEPEYESLLKAGELNLSENELAYIHAYSYKETFKGVLIDDDKFEKKSERNEEIRLYCAENNLHCYVRNTQTNDIYTLNQSASKEAYEKIDSKFSFNIFKK